MKACWLLILGGFCSPILPHRRSVYQIGHRYVSPHTIRVLSSRSTCCSSISKTDYILWRACAKNAWLRIHKPDVYYSTEVTEFEQSVMAMGIEVERVARGLFPDGVAITSSQTDGLEQNSLTDRFKDAHTIPAGIQARRVSGAD